MKVASFNQLSLLQRNLLSGLAGFVFYAAWAYLVNYRHGSLAAGKAAVVQGSYSFVLTLCMTMLIEFVYQQLSKSVLSLSLVRWCTIVCCCTMVFSFSWWVNVIAGTPEIFSTVILGYLIGGIFIIAYVSMLAKSTRI
jgi:hypothetical protein